MILAILHKKGLNAMHYVVNARLVNGTPQLSVIDLQSGQIRLRWKMEKIQEMFDSGEIKRDEFLQPDKYGMNLLLKNLFLIACTHDLEQNTPLQIKTGHKKLKISNNWNFKLNFGQMK